MSVPDTNTFTLQDVVDEIIPDTESLQGCFNEADADAFDSAYEGSKDRLSNFRNYAHRRWVTIRPYLYFGKDLISYAVKKALWANSGDWYNLRNCLGTTPVLVGDDIEISVRNISGEYYMHRGFLMFDLRGLEGTAVKVEVHLRRTTTSGVVQQTLVGMATWDEPLDISEMCSGYAVLAGETFSDYQQSDSSFVHKVEETRSIRLLNFNQNAMNTKITTDLRHNYDRDNIAPGLGVYLYRTYYNGASISQSLIYNTELRIKYTGLPFLNAYPSTFDTSMVAIIQKIYISADDKNNWSAAIESPPGWLTITGVNTGEGSYKIDVNITTNTTSGPRYAIIRIQSDDAHDSLVNINQVRAVLSASPDPWNVNYIGGYQTITVTTDSENVWSATVVQGGTWLSITSGGNGTGGGSFQLHADNNSGIAREGLVDITSYAVTYRVNVNQAEHP